MEELIEAEEYDQNKCYFIKGLLNASPSSPLQSPGELGGGVCVLVPSLSYLPPELLLASPSRSMAWFCLQASSGFSVCVAWNPVFGNLHRLHSSLGSSHNPRVTRVSTHWAYSNLSAFASDVPPRILCPDCPTVTGHLRLAQTPSTDKSGWAPWPLLTWCFLSL